MTPSDLAALIDAGAVAPIGDGGPVVYGLTWLGRRLLGERPEQETCDLEGPIDGWLARVDQYRKRLESAG